MMSKSFIKKQMEVIGLSTNKLKDITGIGYATLSDYLNKEDYGLSAKNYVRLIDTLFTPFEQLLYANAQLKALGTKNDAEYWYDEFKRRKVFNSEKIEIMRSGAPHSDESGVIRMLPAHIKVTFKDIEGSNMIRIFDENLYRRMDNAGKKGKLDLVQEYFKSDQ